MAAGVVCGHRQCYEVHTASARPHSPVLQGHPSSPAQGPPGTTPSHMGAGRQLGLGWLGCKAGTSMDPMWHQSQCPHKGSYILSHGLGVLSGLDTYLSPDAIVSPSGIGGSLMSVFMAEGWAGPPRIPSGHCGCWAERVQTARSPGCTNCVAMTGPGLQLQGPPYLSLSIAPQPERP